ncbi:HAD family hydrolase [Candidatus Woesearchaeota archaeon]|jgi:phosphoglycolate phosphatase-like HAD superfamily hydrolase|nr:HAD family hydrolase [Candidatus Woesearchaeota archaeon]MBT7332122.1 HAD family hydrolase [Candidatus Woesearchaeota archaeon]
MIDLVVWDWNGTVLADTELTVEASNHQIKTFGGNPLTRKEFIKRIYFPITDFLVDQGCDPKLLNNPAFAKTFHQYYEARADKCRTRKGVREVLKYNNTHKIDSLVLSNHVSSEIERQLDRRDLSEYFNAVLAHDNCVETSQGNNKVHRFERYLSETRQDPHNTLIIGDAPEDVGIGKEFGMVTVALTDGFYPTHQLKASNPDYLISNVSRLVDILEEQSQ